MLSRPAIAREKRVERQSSADGNELEKGLDAAILRSAQVISARIDDLIESRYNKLKEQAD